jgi:hypothetical protein
MGSIFGFETNKKLLTEAVTMVKSLGVLALIGIRLTASSLLKRWTFAHT